MITQESLAGLREAIAAARRDAGGLLAGFRHTSALSQAQLARRIGYSTTVVAHAELGLRPVSAEFWELADEALGAGGSLTAWGVRIKNLIRSMREEQRRPDRAGHAERLSRLLPGHDAEDMAAAVPAAGEPAITMTAVRAVQGQLDVARARITELEQENAALQARIRTLTALLAEWTPMPTARPT